MGKENNISGVSKIVMVFILAIIGVVLIDITADAIFPTINKNPVTNESLNIGSLKLGGVSEGADNLSIDNTLGLALDSNNWTISAVRAFNGTTFISDTDYITNESLSLIYFQNTTSVRYNQNISNLTFVDYTWTPAEYIQSSSARVLMGLIILFFAIGLLLFIVGMVWKEIQEAFD